MRYVPPIGQPDDAPYVDFNPRLGIDGSVVPAAAIEHVQREIVNAIAALGETPSDEKLNQLAQALAKKFSGVDDNFNKYALKNHNHTIGDVTGLQDALNSKAPVNHSHPELEPIDAYTKTETDGKIKVVNDALNAHKGAKNPHGTGAGDVGAYTKAQVDALFKSVSSVTQPGMFTLMPFRKTELPAGWYYPSGEYVALTSVIGQVLNSFPANYKSDWGIVVSGTNIRLYDNAKFFNGNFGRFPRMANGSAASYMPGIVESYLLGSHKHTFYGYEASGTTTGYALITAQTSQIRANSVKRASVANAMDNTGGNENRPYSVHFTPAFYLGV